MILKTTTNTCKNQKFIREEKEESFEAIENISVCLKKVSMIHCLTKPMGFIING